MEQLAKQFREQNVLHIEYGDNCHSYYSKVHVGLPKYGPRYYCYLWSGVLAEDVFEHIQKEGLLNPQAGKKYVDTILSCGGSKDASDMVRDYLGREPLSDAFYRKMSLI